MKQVYNYQKQKVVRRNDNNKIQSIKPIYTKDSDSIIQLNELIIELKSSKYCIAKFHPELENLEKISPAASLVFIFIRIFTKR